MGQHAHAISRRNAGRADSKGGGARLSVATVNGLARAAAVPPHVVRYYTRIGLLRAQRNPDNGYKLFNGAHLHRLRFIRQAQELGYTLAEIRHILNDADKGESPCPLVRKILEQRLEENRRRVRELIELQHRIERALKAWKRMPDGTPDGHTVCHLIEHSAEN